jgi:hypothetical protein
MRNARVIRDRPDVENSVRIERMALAGRKARDVPGATA